VRAATPALNPEARTLRGCGYEKVIRKRARKHLGADEAFCERDCDWDFDAGADGGVLFATE
jgi:hypothetical protein